jgi:hypothetical protein
LILKSAAAFRSEVLTRITRPATSALAATTTLTTAEARTLSLIVANQFCNQICRILERNSDGIS